MKIMIVDDNDFSVELLSSMINDSSVNIIRAKDGTEAVEIFSKSPVNDIDIIFMDIVMAEENGDEAVKQIRNLNREDAKTVKVYATTVYTNNFDQKYFDGILSKPFNRDKVLEIINQIK